MYMKHSKQVVELLKGRIGKGGGIKER